MLSARKRKASSENSGENSKLKKLKVSSKIFEDAGSSKVDNVAKAKINKILPEGYESIILTASTKLDGIVEGIESIIGCVRLPIITKEDALLWLKKFEQKTSTSYRGQKTWRNDAKTGLSKRKFVCNYQSSGAYSCQACIIVTIKDAKEIQINPDYYLRDYPSQVIIQFCHNHKIDQDMYQKNPTKELRVIFDTYFANGHSPFSALLCHKGDLHSSYGAQFYDVVSVGNVCPSYNWCFREFEKLFTRTFVEPTEDELNEKLSDAVTHYNTSSGSECAYLSVNPVFSLCISTPLMKSVFRSGFAEDVITVRSLCTPKTLPKRQKLILFLCHTPIGSLPFGIVLSFAEDTATICQGIKSLLTMLGVPDYSPKTVITDENFLISNCLKNSFPKSQVLFNEFQMLQSIWRVIRLVCQENNDELQAVYGLFLLTLNSESESEFNTNIQSLQMYADKYPKLTNFLKYFKSRSKSYVLYARPKVEFNTDVLNYTDSGTIILQDVSIKYGNFFNPLQLFDFLTKTYVNHYERKLVKIVEGDLKGFFKTNFYVPLSKIADFTCEKVTDTEFLVRVSDAKFFVNAELDTCTCQVAVYGGSCIHQYIVEKNLGLVPECYTPLEEDMLDVFKTILSYKEDKKKELSTASLKRNQIDDHTSSECDTVSDNENLSPLDEIYLSPSEVTDSFIDNDMSPLELSEYEDSNEDNDEFLNDNSHYNRESGELEPIGSPLNATTSITDNHDDESPKHAIVYGCREDDTKSNDTMEDIPIEDSIVLTTDIDDDDYNITDSADAPVVYTYEDENEVYEGVMTESDKTAEIAEFLTNLPDTNNSSYNSMTTGDPVVSSTDSHRYTLQGAPTKSNRDSEEASEVLKRFQTQITPPEETEIASGGVVVLKNDEFFTQYRVMENGVLSVVTDTDDEYANQIKAFQASSNPNLMADSYEEANFIMMSPTDIFDNSENENSNEAEKADSRINVLSSVVIKPSDEESAGKEIFTPKSPLNLNTIKHKTLRIVKEDSRSKLSEPVIAPTGKVHKTLKSESENINASAIEEEEPGSEKNDEDNADSENTCDDIVEQKEKSTGEDHDYSIEDNPCEEIEDNVCQDIEVNTCEETDDDACQEIEDVLPDKDAQTVLTGMNLTECDPAQLAEEMFADVIEIDSDDLDELAAQDYEPIVVKHPSKQPVLSPLKVMPLKCLPFNLLPKKNISVTGKAAAAKAVPLRDFLAKKVPNTLLPVQAWAQPKKNQQVIPSKTIAKPKTCENQFIEGQLTTAFSQLTDLANKNTFKGSVEKFLGKFKELGNDGSLINALESFGSDVPREKPDDQLPDKDAAGIKDAGGSKEISSLKPEDVKTDLPITKKAECDSTSKHIGEYDRSMAEGSDLEDWEFDYSDSDESSIFSDSDEFSSTEFEHYSDCRTSCSEFHSELEVIVDLSDYEVYELQPNKFGASTSEMKMTERNVKLPLKEGKGETKPIIKKDSDFPGGRILNKNKKDSEPSSVLKQLASLHSQRTQGASKTYRKKPIRKPYRHLNDDSDLSDESDIEEQPKVVSKPVFNKKKASGVAEELKAKLNLALPPPIKAKNEVSNSKPGKATKINPLAITHKYKLSKDVTIVSVPPKNYIPQSVSDMSTNNRPKSSMIRQMPIGNRKEIFKQELKPVNRTTNSADPKKSPKKSTKIKDAEDLETILMGVDDVKSEPAEDPNKASILANEELSFLFNDSRFEAVLVDSDSEDNDVKPLQSNKGTIKKEDISQLTQVPQRTIKADPVKRKTAPHLTKSRPILKLPKPTTSSNRIIVLPSSEIKPEVSKKLTKRDVIKPDKATPNKSKEHSLSSRERSSRANQTVDEKVLKKQTKPRGKQGRRYLPKQLLNLIKEAEGFTKTRCRTKVKIEDDIENTRSIRSRRNSQSSSIDTPIKKSKKNIPTNAERQSKEKSPRKSQLNRTKLATDRPKSQEKLPVKRKPPKIPKTPRRKADGEPPSSLQLYNESLDFENSIEASVLEKKPDFLLLQEWNKLVASTPIKPVKYEDAFRNFLETSNGATTSRSLSDLEVYRDEAEAEFFGRRRTKSVTSHKASGSNNNSKMKKSVSWADGLDVIEYFEESASDSDESEIRMTMKRGNNKKLARSISPDYMRVNRENVEKTSSSLSWKKVPQSRLRSISLKGQKKRSTTVKGRKQELVVRLQRNPEIESMCRSLGNYPVRQRRSMYTQRRGYKELMDQAKRIRGFN